MFTKLTTCLVNTVANNESKSRRYGIQFLMKCAVWLLSGTVALLFMMSLGLLLYSSWRYVERIDPIERHLDYLSQIELVEVGLSTVLLELLESETGTIEPDDFNELRAQLEQLQISKASLVTASPAIIGNALEQFNEFDGQDRFPVEQALYGMRQAMHREFMAHRSMLHSFAEKAERAQRIALALAATLLLVSILLWLMAQRRIIEPLKNLGYLMTLLARRDYNYTTALVATADPIVRPLLDNYNHMVQRLYKLEQAQQQRQDSLTDVVRGATHVMLQQQRRLAQAERLGAVGEVAASVAHELRNPLTSVQMALDNLRQDIAEPELVERIDLILTEVKRATRQLNQLLNDARQIPEKSQQVAIATELEELITLASYQLHENISVRYKTEEDLNCQLPKGRFRQVLLNLILNAGQVLGSKPGEITVVAQSRQDKLEVTVADTGPGFPEDILAAGVQAFSSWRIGGTGLGLVMVRRFAHDLDGELTLKNNATSGACVTLILPCRLDNV